MAKLNWAILGTGGIARAFAKGLLESETGVLSWTGSRNPETGEAFAKEYGGSFGSYDDAVTNREVNAVYIALPHHLHEEWTIRSAQAGKAILCEKPFTLDSASAERALSVVEKEGVFFMEAFMYRCTPQTQFIRQTLSSGRLGKLLHISSEFGFAASIPWANFRTVNAYGGGALMDVGCYCVSMSILAAQEEPLRAQYVYAATPERYDRLGAGILDFPSGITADFRTAVHHNLPNRVEFWGSEGKLVIHNPWFGSGLVEFWNPGGTEKTDELEFTPDKNLYAQEADAVHASLGDRQSPAMPISDTRMVMKTLDALRASSGFHFDPLTEDQK
jgi:predicted dehydrogenase